MLRLKYFAFAVIIALLDPVNASILRGSTADNDSDGLEKLKATIDHAHTSFDVISKYMDNVEINAESMQKMERIVATMERLEPAFTGLGDKINEANGDENHWRDYSNVLDRYSSLMDTVRFKMEL
mmetsp:Transcript_44915/g.54420  ORF Transcript_44915/g.54420 Transcript_44915/m.54420 type:complete len:125 (+) Transcript_44915:61-435(+)|eukprot:CAMPEP_0172501276 /NCGR_PEP_ID=MMETSP1066-20121228/147844_1 /TAXON_ID=671091 /ORGANISM="Coscinodiscus wailesii, Strain CCMP2513" /LENGTH=124 /DNA_ID=CAMNT_0013275953 /DNA_START=51 /DNA_END=425 /DNA_ORIENTATION=-